MGSGFNPFENMNRIGESAWGAFYMWMLVVVAFAIIGIVALVGAAAYLATHVRFQ